MHVCFGKFITDFTVFENRISIFFFFFFFFSFLDCHCLIFFIYFVFNNILKVIWNFKCNDFSWLRNGEGPLGVEGCVWGGGEHYKPSVVGGGGKAVAEEMTDLSKICPALPPQLINNDRPLKYHRFKNFAITDSKYITVICIIITQSSARSRGVIRKGT